MKAICMWQGAVASVVLALSVGQAAAKEAAEVGLVTLVQGSVQVGERGAKLAPAIPFVKLRVGTRVEVGENGRFQVVYLSNGLQETWDGGSQIEVGETESKPSRPGKLPSVKQLSAAILKGLTQAPMMIADMRSRQGMIRVRAIGDVAKLEAAETDYKALRAQSDDSDVTPELFLLATLSELKLYDKMKQPLEAMVARQPGNQEIRALHDAYVKQINSR